jgi:hypothetical protein
MQTKKWYQSKTIVASIIGVIISGLALIQNFLLNGTVDQTALVSVLTSAYAIYGRIVSNSIIE